MWDLTIHLLQGPASLRALVPFFNRCGTLQFTPFRIWHTASCPPPSVSGCDTERFPHPYKECFIILLPTDMRSRNPPLTGPSVLANTRSTSNRCGTPQSPPPLEPNVLISTPPYVHLL